MAETRIEPFRHQVWDEASHSLNLPYLSYLLFSFLPVQMLQRLHLQLLSSIRENVRWRQYFYKKRIVDVFATGSSAEGLSCPSPVSNYPHEFAKIFKPPNSTLSDKTIEKIYAKDVDIMYKCSSAFEIECRSTDSHPTLHPGYARLVRRCKGSFTEDGRYVKHSDMNIVHIQGTAGEKHGGDLHVRYDRPAVTFYGNKPCNGILHQSHVDNVPCLLSHPEWPEQASEWLLRQRPSGWPSRDLIYRVKATGCLFVPKAHTSNSDIEWRFSFSEAELILAQSLTWTQRQCYVLVKLLCKHVLRDCVQWCTYYLKTVFLWCCEHIPSEYWKPMYLSNCALYILDQLLVFLRRGNIPNYFIISNNMISHISMKEIGDIIKNIQSLRNDPVGHLIEWTETYPCVFLPWVFSFQNVYSKTIRAVRSKTKVFSLGHVTENTREVVMFLTMEGKIIHAIDRLEHKDLFMPNGQPSDELHEMYDIFMQFLRTDRIHLLVAINNFAILLHKEPRCAYYSEICSRINHMYLVQGLRVPFLQDNQSRFYSRFSWCLSLYLSGRYKEAYGTSVNVLRKLKLLNVAVDLIPMVDNPLFMNERDIFEVSCHGTADSNFLYLMIKSRKKAKLPIDEVEIIAGIAQTLRYPCKVTLRFSAYPLAFVFEEMGCYVHAALYLSMKDEPYDAQTRSVHIMTCVVLELLTISLERSSAIGSIMLRFRQLARRVLQILKQPWEADTSNASSIGYLLLHLARLYEHLIPRNIRGEHYTSSIGHPLEKCYLSYRSSLEYDRFLQIDALKEFISFLCRWRHPDLIYIHELYTRLYYLKQDTRHLEVLHHRPFIPFPQLPPRSIPFHLFTDHSLSCVLLKCLEKAAEAE